MQNSCQEMGKGGCSMMDGGANSGMMGGGRMQGRGTGTKPDAPPPPSDDHERHHSK
jgi:hypothetical protein